MSLFRVFTDLENPAKDRSTKHVSKSTAIKWVGMGTHKRIDRRTIQALSPEEIDRRRVDCPPQIISAPTPFIPEILEPIIDKRLRVYFDPPAGAPRYGIPAVLDKSEFLAALP